MVTLDLETGDVHLIKFKDTTKTEPSVYVSIICRKCFSSVFRNIVLDMNCLKLMNGIKCSFYFRFIPVLFRIRAEGDF